METPGQVSVLRCRKCRKCVVDSASLLSINAVDEVATECRIWHVDFDALPAWILASVHQAQWTTGRLTCQNCGARLGGFNFVSRTKCPCGLDLTVHLCKSRLDQDSGAAAKEASPTMTATYCEFGPMTAALETWPSDTEASPSHARTAPEPLVPTRPETIGGAVKVAHRKARRFNYGRGGGARTGLSGSLFQQTCFDGEAAQSGPVRVPGSAPPQACPTAASQELEDRAETTSIQEACTLRRRRPSQTSPEEEEEESEEEEEGGRGRLCLLLRLSKRERNRLKSQRRKQRRRERWIQSRLQEHTQSLLRSGTSSEDEGTEASDREGFICAVCLDIYFSPYMCQPCHHVFCEPCLRTLARNRPSSTPCPLCRTIVTHVLYQKELSNMTKTVFPKLYLSRKQCFQKANCARWPLPSTRKLFRMFGGLRWQASPGDGGTSPTADTAWTCWTWWSRAGGG
ncbi:hypothetical protein AAFF_G00372410 [Aldrovandia affinis]|uniref:E3 ubiquitin-protein ligase RNF180 n=1 Tax=Aldrovandia affinis TaxID=143900 RepID=A0AAD7SID1_9TELE|nr:hypothetical protein AAFF_G00372410 [Aldrovandia affinis]